MHGCAVTSQQGAVHVGLRQRGARAFFGFGLARASYHSPLAIHWLRKIQVMSAGGLARALHHPRLPAVAHLEV